MIKFSFFCCYLLVAHVFVSPSQAEAFDVSYHGAMEQVATFYSVSLDYPKQKCLEEALKKRFIGSERHFLSDLNLDGLSNDRFWFFSISRETERIVHVFRFSYGDDDGVISLTISFIIKDKIEGVKVLSSFSYRNEGHPMLKKN